MKYERIRDIEPIYNYDPRNTINTNTVDDHNENTDILRHGYLDIIDGDNITINQKSIAIMGTIFSSVGKKKYNNVKIKINNDLLVSYANKYIDLLERTDRKFFPVSIEIIYNIPGNSWINLKVAKLKKILADTDTDLVYAEL